MKHFQAIAAMSENRVIGCDNGLRWPPMSSHMRGWLRVLTTVFVLLSWALRSESATPGHQGKEHGVYTTLYTPESYGPRASFDMPGSAYFEYDNFGPGETPLAIVSGYGSDNVELELFDLGTQKTLMSKTLFAGPGRASVQPLLINESGQYEVRLLLRGKQADSFKFSVKRDTKTNRVGETNYDAILAYANLLLNLDASNPVPHNLRGSVYAGRGQWDLVVTNFSEVIRLNPQDAVAYFLRAEAYEKQKKWTNAASDLDNFLSLRTQDSRGLFMRSFVRLKLEQPADAVADLRVGIRISPNDARARNELAWLLATLPRADLRNGTEAIGNATKACELTGWKTSSYVDTLAAACAETGDFDRAIKYEKQALAGADLSAASRDDLRKRLQLYERHQAYHQPEPEKTDSPAGK